MRIFEWFKSHFSTPSSDLYLKIDESGVTNERPDGLFETIQWRNLQKVTVVKTDKGPFANETCFVLYGLDNRCVISMGTPQAGTILEYLKKFPGFDDNALNKESSSHSSEELLCWARTSKQPNCDELPRHLHGSLSTKLSRREIADLFVRHGWSIQSINFHDYEVFTKSAVLLMTRENPILLCGSIASVEEVVPMLVTVLSSAGIEYQFESVQLQDDLVKAISRQDIPAIKHLLAAGADPNHRGCFWSSAIECAAEIDETGEIIRLLAAAGADINIHGGNPLFITVDGAIDAAAQLGRPIDWSAVGVLLDFGADPTIRNAQGESVFDWASAYGNYARESFEDFLRARSAYGLRSSKADDQ